MLVIAVHALMTGSGSGSGSGANSGTGSGSGSSGSGSGSGSSGSGSGSSGVAVALGESLATVLANVLPLATGLGPLASLRWVAVA
jgi:hypothetical protein